MLDSFQAMVADPQVAQGGSWPKSSFEAPDASTFVISGCPFAPRCAYVEDRCRTSTPELEVHSAEQLSGCVRHAELGKQLVGATA